MAFEGFPFIVGLELTLACNLKCRHCASSATTATRNNELSLPEWLSICDQFSDLFVQEVDITGGEPLLRSEWFDISRNLHKKNIPVRMVSNGLLLKKNAARIADSGIATVGISLDGTEAMHDNLRQRPGLFRQIIDGIESALMENIPIAVITAVNDLNIGELPALEKFLCDLGIKDWQVQPTFALGRAKQQGTSLSEATFLELGRFVQQRKEPSSPDRIEIIPADGVGYYSELDTRNCAWNGCSAGISSCGITSDGMVKGCLSLPDKYVEGSLRDRQLWDIWFDEHSFHYTREFSPEQLGDNCKNCQHGENCKGGCSVVSLASSERFRNNPYCFHRLLTNDKKRDTV